MQSARIPPHDKEAERACIASAMLDAECCSDLLEALTPNDFFIERHGVVWEAIERCHAQGHAVDTIGVRGQLGDHGLQRAGGDEYLLGMTDIIPTVASATKYAKRVVQLAHVRAVAHRCAEIYASALSPIENLDDWIDGTEALLMSMPEHRGAYRSVPYSDVVDVAYKAVQAQAASGSHMLGPPIGLRKVDDHLRGLAPSWFVVIAARPGMGKTALAENALRAAGGGIVFSLEMDKRQFGTRSLSAVSGVDGHQIRGATKLTREEWMKLTRAGGELSELPIRFWDKPGTTLQEICRETRRVDREMRGGLKLIVIDYLQLVQLGGKSRRTREEEVGEISRTLKMLAKELQICVLALAQLNRGVESRPNKRPLPSDLRESGAIEQDADVIMFVYRDEVYNPYNPDAAQPMKDNRGIAEIILSKNREGSTGTAVVQWRKETTTFRDLDQREDHGNAPHWDSDR